MRTFLLGLLLISLPLTTVAKPANPQTIFLSAMQSLHQGKMTQFLTQANQLRDYPLYPYLIYTDLMLHLPQASATTVQHFLTTYQQTPLAARLRQQWLAQLFQQQQWQAFLKFYQPVPTNQPLTCQYHWVLWQTQQTALALQNLNKLLANTTHPPASCLAVLSQALQRGKLGEDIVWQQIAFAFEHKNIATAQAYANLLNSAVAKQKFILWERLYQQPTLLASPIVWQQLGNLHHPIVDIVFQQLAPHHTQLAITLLQKIHTWPTFSVADQQVAIGAIAVALAQAHAPQANQWLKLVSPAYLTPTILQWRLRTDLYQQQWTNLRNDLQQLPPAIQAQPQWQYWQARALAAQGKVLSARLIYRELALRGNFYGQLASLQLHQPPLFALKQLTINPAQIQALANLPALQRAKQLYQLHWLTEAHQEWQWALMHIPNTDYLTAAELAIQWGWYNQAIITVNHLQDDLGLRYPLAYQADILSAAHRQQLNPAWVFALIRQESLFSPTIRSSAGALGLMQILPSTGQLMARQLQINFMPIDLLQPNLNLWLGTLYLKQLITRFHGNTLLATAAYNAGPGRVVGRVVKRANLQALGFVQG